MIKRKKNLKGFTLIELLVVVAIIGILAAVGVTAYSGYTVSAKKSTTKSNPTWAFFTRSMCLFTKHMYLVVQ